MLCVLPGILDDTCCVSFTSSLPVFGVYEDGKYLGNGHDSLLKTTSGSHTFTYTYEGIEIGKEEIKLPRCIFFTLFSRRGIRVTPHFTFTEEVRKTAVDRFAEETALLSLVTEWSDKAEYPEYITRFALTCREMDIRDMRSIWLYTLLHVTSGEMYDDAVSAELILRSFPAEYSSEDSMRVMDYLDELYGEKSVRKIEVKDETDSIVFEKDGDYFTYRGAKVTLGKDSDTSYPSSDTLGITLSYDTFSIASSFVTENDYALFVENNRKWSRENIEELMAEGLVDENYLKDISLSVRSSLPIRYISYYAAKAYCEWKSKVDGILYSLPTEAEWTVAALSSSSRPYVTTRYYTDSDSSSPSGLMGQLWDMTETPYIPLMRLVSTATVESLEEMFPYDGIILHGGSYVNDNVTISTVGTAYRNSSSPYNGFRLVKHVR